MFGGSAGPDDLGEMLVDAGVNLISHYGATEVGQLMTSHRELGDKEWIWLRPPPALFPYLRWVEHGDACEAVIAHGWQGKVTSNQPDGSYATRDLFVRHWLTPCRAAPGSCGPGAPQLAAFRSALPPHSAETRAN